MDLGQLFLFLVFFVIGIVNIFFPKYARTFKAYEIGNKIEEPTGVSLIIKRIIGIIFIILSIGVLFSLI